MTKTARLKFPVIFVCGVTLLLAGCSTTSALQEAFDNKNWTRVCELGEKLIHEEPDSYEGYYYLGLAHLANEHWTLAIENLTKVEKLNRDIFTNEELNIRLSEACSNDALSQLHTQYDLPQYEAQIQRACNLYAQNTDAQALWGLLQANKGNTVEARTILQNIEPVNISQLYPILGEMLGRFYLSEWLSTATVNNSIAIELLEKSEKFGNARAQLERIKIAVISNDMDFLSTQYGIEHCKEILHKALEQEPNNHQLYHYLSIIDFEAYEWNKAKDNLLRTQDLNPSYFAANELNKLLSQAITESLYDNEIEHWAYNGYEEHSADITLACDLDQNNTDAKVLKTILLFNRQNSEEAATLAESIPPSYVWRSADLEARIMHDLGEYYLEQAENQEKHELSSAVEWYWKGVNLGHTESFVRLGSIALLLSDVEILDKLEPLAPTFIDGQYGCDLPIKISDKDSMKKYHNFIEQAKHKGLKVCLEIAPAIPDGYVLRDVNWLDEDNLLICWSTIVDQKNLHYRFDKYNMASEESLLVYEQETEGPLKLNKVLDNGNICLQEEDTFLIIDNDTYEIVKTVTCPNYYGKGADISHDGTKIVYVRDDGLCLLTDESEPTLFLERTGDLMNIGSTLPVSPAWSPDDSSITYVEQGWEWTNGLGIVSSDGTEQRFFKHRNAFFPEWKDNSAINFVETSEERPWRYLNLNLATDEIVESPTDGTRLEYSLANDKLSYLRDVGLGYAIMVSDTIGENEIPISTIVDYDYNSLFSRWSPSGEKLLFGAGLYRSVEELTQMYIVDIE